MTDRRPEEASILSILIYLLSILYIREIGRRSSGMKTEAIGQGEGAEDPSYPEHQHLQPASASAIRKRRFWVVPVLAAIPTLLVILLIFLLKDYDFPKEVVGILFITVVIPAALICEKLGLGQFNILGGSTIPDWLFYSVMILLVYLYSLALVASGRGIVSLMGRALRGGRKVIGD